MEAWLRMVMEMMEGVSLQASPSTCMGIVLVVMMRADLHCVMQVPCPPACSRGWNTAQISTQIPVTPIFSQIIYLHSGACNWFSLSHRQWDNVIITSVVHKVSHPTDGFSENFVWKLCYSTEPVGSPDRMPPPPFSMRPLYWLLKNTLLCSRFENITIVLLKIQIFCDFM